MKYFVNLKTGDVVTGATYPALGDWREITAEEYFHILKLQEENRAYPIGEKSVSVSDWQKQLADPSPEKSDSFSISMSRPAAIAIRAGLIQQKKSLIEQARGIGMMIAEIEKLYDLGKGGIDEINK